MSVIDLPLYRDKRVEIWCQDKMDADRPLFILAHGAGNNMNTAFLTTISTHLQERNINIVRFNFPYMVAGKKIPDRSEILEDAWKLVIEWAIKNLQFSGLFIGGKSMGGRIATMVANEFAQLNGLIFLGYPLHPPGRFDDIRDSYLFPLMMPMLFIQGTRDGHARMDLLQTTLNDLRNRATLHWVEGGDHSFKVLVRQGVSYPAVLENVSVRVADWIEATQLKHG